MDNAMGLILLKAKTFFPPLKRKSKRRSDSDASLQSIKKQGDGSIIANFCRNASLLSSKMQFSYKKNSFSPSEKTAARYSAVLSEFRYAY